MRIRQWLMHQCICLYTVYKYELGSQSPKLLEQLLFEERWLLDELVAIPSHQECGSLVIQTLTKRHYVCSRKLFQTTCQSKDASSVCTQPCLDLSVLLPSLRFFNSTMFFSSGHKSSFIKRLSSEAQNVVLFEERDML